MGAILVTGSAGHLGEALMRRLAQEGHGVGGLDTRCGPFVDVVGSVADRAVVRSALSDIEVVVHAAALHKPHIATHPRQDFVDANVTGTLVLLEEAVRARIRAFVFTSTTSAFGRALAPGPHEPAAWITEDVVARPRNIYGATKVAAEELCELVHRDHGLPCLILRTSRFFAEADDQADRRAAYADLNLKVCELLYRRVDLDDAVSAHVRAIERARSLGFGRYIISATTPFTPDDLAALRVDTAAVVAGHHPGYERIFAARGWRMLSDIERIYVNDRARRDLDWQPRYDFGAALAALEAEQDPRSELAATIGAKGYAERDRSYR
jgi:UDP-glucose 4-epimerase